MSFESIQDRRDNRVQESYVIEEGMSTRIRMHEWEGEKRNPVPNYFGTGL
jgi:hypothetical protein